MKPLKKIGVGEGCGTSQHYANHGIETIALKLVIPIPKWLGEIIYFGVNTKMCFHQTRFNLYETLTAVSSTSKDVMLSGQLWEKQLRYYQTVSNSPLYIGVSEN